MAMIDVPGSARFSEAAYIYVAATVATFGFKFQMNESGSGILNGRINNNVQLERKAGSNVELTQGLRVYGMFQHVE